MQSRTRTVSIAAVNGGAPCTGTTSDMVDCTVEGDCFGWFHITAGQSCDEFCMYSNKESCHEQSLRSLTTQPRLDYVLDQIYGSMPMCTTYHTGANDYNPSSMGLMGDCYLSSANATCAAKNMMNARFCCCSSAGCDNSAFGSAPAVDIIFAGDLTMLSPAEQETMKTSVQASLVANGVDPATILDIQLSSGSIIATVTFTTVNVADQVFALAQDSMIVANIGGVEVYDLHAITTTTTTTPAPSGSA
jgi:hypothetical protein